MQGSFGALLVLLSCIGICSAGHHHSNLYVYGSAQQPTIQGYTPESGYFDPIAKYFVTGNIKAPYVDAAYKDSRGIFAISMNGQVVDFATAYPEARIEQASLKSKTLASAGTKPLNMRNGAARWTVQALGGAFSGGQNVAILSFTALTGGAQPFEVDLTPYYSHYPSYRYNGTQAVSIFINDVSCKETGFSSASCFVTDTFQCLVWRVNLEISSDGGLASQSVGLFHNAVPATEGSSNSACESFTKAEQMTGNNKFSFNGIEYSTSGKYVLTSIPQVVTSGNPINNQWLWKCTIVNDDVNTPGDCFPVDVVYANYLAAVTRTVQGADGIASGWNADGSEEDESKLLIGGSLVSQIYVLRSSSATPWNKALVSLTLSTAAAAPRIADGNLLAPRCLTPVDVVNFFGKVTALCNQNFGGLYGGTTNPPGQGYTSTFSVVLQTAVGGVMHPCLNADCSPPSDDHEHPGEGSGSDNDEDDDLPSADQIRAVVIGIGATCLVLIVLLFVVIVQQLRQVRNKGMAGPAI